jgi:hypothetical protein
MNRGILLSGVISSIKCYILKRLSPKEARLDAQALISHFEIYEGTEIYAVKGQVHPTWQGMGNPIERGGRRLHGRIMVTPISESNGRLAAATEFPHIICQKSWRCDRSQQV